GAGENWDELVSLCVARGLYGLENLSGIPGTVGAAPIQNIGAYGSEVKDVTASVEVYDTKTRKQKTLSRLSCKFGYRDSIFKREGSPYVITNVRFSLAKEGELNLSYRDMREFFEREKSLKPDLKSVRAAVLEIRSRKFPDLEIVGTAGSFFKNPIVAKSVYISLKKKYPELPGFPAGRGKMKLSLAWIIDHVCKLKDLRAGDSGVAPHQTLVICNFGSARATEIKELADRISKAVYETTGITIEPEVKIIP
ncbi:MAG TPA: UDP-N-acetylmuramate dehydrogenase, partial [Candidatus Paceibacterota bacterium]